jgi:hypothetical protein
LKVAGAPHDRIGAAAMVVADALVTSAQSLPWTAFLAIRMAGLNVKNHHALMV